MSSTNPSDFGAGAVIMWAGSNSNIPAGWHECDGTLLSTTDYSTLYGVIGLSFGKSPPSGQFYLPDLRGQFVRGVDDGAGTDPDSATRTDMQDPSIAWNGVGSVQSSALQTHTHSYDTVDTNASDGNIQDKSGYNVEGYNSGAPEGANVSQSETRPTNAYLYYIIKL